MMEQRERLVNNLPINHRGRCVIYWMYASQRVDNNFALNYAIEKANEISKALVCYFGIEETVPMGSARMFAFMLYGIKETAEELEKRQIPFIARIESPAEGIIRLERELDPCLIVVDEKPGYFPAIMRARATKSLSVPLSVVDSESIIPLRAWEGEISDCADMKKKAPSLLRKHLQQITTPKVKVEGKKLRVPRRMKIQCIDVADLANSLRCSMLEDAPLTIPGGSSAAKKALQEFVQNHLADYSKQKKNPAIYGTSGLSSYLRHGQIWAGEVAMAIKAADVPAVSKKAFLDNLILKREYAMNFCLYHTQNNNSSMFERWLGEVYERKQKTSLSQICSRDQLEHAATDDLLWNATQKELLATGLIHPALRTYWAKQIQVFTPNTEEAWETAVYLNDKYSLDGRSFCGYFNIASCLGGIHAKPQRHEDLIFDGLKNYDSAAILKRVKLKEYGQRVNHACQEAGLNDLVT